MSKQVRIVFGEMGAGKNYWGVRLAKKFGLEFFDGDDVATPEMIERVSKFKPLNHRIVSHYVHEVLGPEIVKRASKSERGIVVAQALYSNINRRGLSTYLAAHGFDVSFYWVQPSLFSNVRQIFSRENGTKWVAYFLMNKPFFEKPTHKYWTLNPNAARLGVH